MDNSRIANSRTGHLADWSTRGLDNSRTSQLADWTSRGLDNSRSRRCRQKGKLSMQSCRWHPRVVQSATCPVRELSSPRDVQSASRPSASWQSASWRIRELSSNRLELHIWMYSSKRPKAILAVAAGLIETGHAVRHVPGRLASRRLVRGQPDRAAADDRCDARSLSSPTSADVARRSYDDRRRSGALQDRVVSVVRGDGRLVSVRRQVPVRSRRLRAAVGRPASALQDAAVSHVPLARILRLRTSMSLHPQRRRASSAPCRRRHRPGENRNSSRDETETSCYTSLPPDLHRFRDIAFGMSKIAIFGYPSCV